MSGGGVDPAGGHAVRREQLPAGRRCSWVRVHSAMRSSSSSMWLTTGRVVDEARVVGQLRPAHGGAQPGEHRVGVAGDQHVGPVRRRIGVGRGHPGQDAPGAAPGDPGDLEVGQGGLHQGGHRLVDGDVDLLAPTAAVALGHRGQRAHHGEEAGQRVAQADAAPRRRPIRVAGRGPDAAHRLTDRAEAGVGGAGAGLPEPRHVDDDDARGCRLGASS